jgi:hypothetical protein
MDELQPLVTLFRLLVVAMLCGHGIAHLLWFAAAWTHLDTGVGDGPWLLPGKVTIRSGIGRMLGLIALLTTLVVLYAAALLLFGQPAWPAVANLGALMSFAAVGPWLRQSPGSSAKTLIVADMVILFVLALPLRAELTGG